MARTAVFFLIVMLYTCSAASGQAIYTLAGDGLHMYKGDGGPATDASFDWPSRVAVDAAGNVYVADFWNNRIRVVNHSSGIITTIAGNGTYLHTGDGGPATAAGINSPKAITFDRAGNLYFAADSMLYPGTSHYVVQGSFIRKVDTAGVISTIAGTGAAGSSGDGGPATAASFDPIYGLAVDSTGNVYVGGMGYHIRKINTAGIITTIGGNGLPGYAGDGGPATAAKIYMAYDLVLDHKGNLYFSAGWRIRKIDAYGIISTIAGDTTWGYSGDGGPATAARLQSVMGLTYDATGNIYFVDGGNYVIRKIDTSGTIFTIAGNHTSGGLGDGGPPDSAQFFMPEGIAVDTAGNVYVSDVGNENVRVICPKCMPLAIAAIASAGRALHIWPEPNNGAFMLYVSSVVNEPAKIVIINTMGQKITERTISTNQKTEISLDVPPGVYFVTAVTGQGRLYEKVVVR
jgi:hypothetical protein